MKKTKILLVVVILISMFSCNRTTSTSNTNSDQKVVEKEKVEEKSTEDEKAVEVKEKVEIKETSKYYLQLAYEAHNAGDFEKAIQLFGQAIQDDPTDPKAFDGRGMSKYKSGDKDGACSDWQNAVELGSAMAGNMVNDYCL